MWPVKVAVYTMLVGVVTLFLLIPMIIVYLLVSTSQGGRWAVRRIRFMG